MVVIVLYLPQNYLPVYGSHRLVIVQVYETHGTYAYGQRDTALISKGPADFKFCSAHSSSYISVVACVRASQVERGTFILDKADL